MYILYISTHVVAPQSCNRRRKGGGGEGGFGCQRCQAVHGARPRCSGTVVPIFLVLPVESLKSVEHLANLQPHNLAYGFTQGIAHRLSKMGHDETADQQCKPGWTTIILGTRGSEATMALAGQATPENIAARTMKSLYPAACAR